MREKINIKDELSARETMETIAQTGSIVIKNVSIPGVSTSFAILAEIITMFEPNPINEINRKLDEVNKKLDNMFNVVMGALDLHGMETRLSSADSLAKQIQWLIEYDDEVELDPNIFKEENSKLLGDSSVVLKSKIIELGAIVQEQVQNCVRAFDSFEVDYNGNMTLQQYVGAFSYLVSLVLATATTAQACLNQLVSQDDELYEKKYGKMVVGICDENQKVLDNYINKTVPNNYPKWCKQIFEGKPFLLQNNKYEDRHLKANGKSGKCRIEQYSEKIKEPQTQYDQKIYMAEQDFHEEERVWHIEQVNVKTKDVNGSKKWYCSSEQVGDLQNDDLKNPVLIDVDKYSDSSKTDVFKILVKSKTLVIEYPFKNKEFGNNVGVIRIRRIGIQRSYYLAAQKYKEYDPESQWDIKPAHT